MFQFYHTCQVQAMMLALIFYKGLIFNAHFFDPPLGQASLLLLPFYQIRRKKLCMVILLYSL
jgi:hypothetical protein